MKSGSIQNNNWFRISGLLGGHLLNANERPGEQTSTRTNAETTREPGRFPNASNGPKRTPFILVPVDLTKDSLPAIRMAATLARQSGAELRLVHAIHLNLSPYGPANVTRLTAELREESAALMCRLVQFAESMGVVATYVIESGNPATAIARVAERWHVDLIVMAPRQRSWLAKWFGKRTVEAVRRKTDCSVMVLSPESSGKLKSNRIEQISQTVV